MLQLGVTEMRRHTIWLYLLGSSAILFRIAFHGAIRGYVHVKCPKVLRPFQEPFDACSKNEIAACSQMSVVFIVHSMAALRLLIV
jgi:hypothetical protein